MRTDGYFHKVKAPEPVKTDLFDMERMIQLRDFMRDELRDEQVDMCVSMNSCGTAGCIAGWASVIFGMGNYSHPMTAAKDALGLDFSLASRLFEPPGFFIDSGSGYPKARVIRCLDRMIETGEGPRWDLA